jgi:hypothetical protein
MVAIGTFTKKIKNKSKIQLSILGDTSINKPRLTSGAFVFCFTILYANNPLLYVHFHTFAG